MGGNIMPSSIKIIAILVYAAGIGACIYFISGETLTPRESALLSLILTILSVLASWTVAHIYTESQHSKAIKEVQEFHKTNLKTYALKAAEKVNNLSNELNRLSIFLEKELNTTYENPSEALSAKEERIESSIHIVNTLKSVNDTALSDWEGVIGDELEQQREEKEKREEEFGELVSKYESLMNILETEFSTRGDDTQLLRGEIESLRRELHFLHSRMIGAPLRLSDLSYARKNTVETKCPVCSNSLVYRQKGKKTSVKALKCSSCGSSLVSRYDQSSGFTVELRRPILEKFLCPNCSKESRVEIDPVPGSIVTTTCNSCNRSIRINRTIDGLRVRLIEIPVPKPNKERIQGLNEDIIKLVNDSLPHQPWPKGIHKSVAQKLKLPDKIVSSAIYELIRRGAFNPQINGKVYIPAPSIDSSDPQSRNES
jgi:predicted RNA-binding Zn-ribbon protein involved in translation (DUF1610 family)